MKQYEKLLYRTNSVSYWLAMVFLVFNTCQTIFTLNNVNIAAVGILVLEIILLNIVVSFLVFIIASEMKRYNLFWTYLGLGLGIFELIRVFFISKTIPAEPRLVILISLLVSGVFLVAASVISLDLCKKRNIALAEQKASRS